jgi:hypothetical protein
VAGGKENTSQPIGLIEKCRDEWNQINCKTVIAPSAAVLTNQKTVLLSVK